MYSKKYIKEPFRKHEHSNLWKITEEASIDKN